MLYEFAPFILTFAAIVVGAGIIAWAWFSLDRAAEWWDERQRQREFAKMRANLDRACKVGS